MCPAGGAAESLPLRRLGALHAPTMPHTLDQRARLVELRALLLQVPGAGHQHQEPIAGERLRFGGLGAWGGVTVLKYCILYDPIGYYIINKLLNMQ